MWLGGERGKREAYAEALSAEGEAGGCDGLPESSGIKIVELTSEALL